MMKTNIQIIGILVFSFITLIGGYKYYHHVYIDTLMLSEIVGKTDNPAINIAIKLGDFDTQLTRHDISQLNDKKDYWLRRIHEVQAMNDPDLQEQASLILIDEMMKDPVLSKISKGILSLGTKFAFSIIEVAL